LDFQVEKIVHLERLRPLSPGAKLIYRKITGVATILSKRKKENEEGVRPSQKFFIIAIGNFFNIIKGLKATLANKSENT